MKNPHLNGAVKGGAGVWSLSNFCAPLFFVLRLAATRSVDNQTLAQIEQVS